MVSKSKRTMPRRVRHTSPCPQHMCLSFVLTFFLPHTTEDTKNDKMLEEPTRLILKVYASVVITILLLLRLLMIENQTETPEYGIRILRHLHHFCDEYMKVTESLALLEGLYSFVHPITKSHIIERPRKS